MRRTTIGILLTALVLAAGFSVYQTAYWFWARRIVRTALSYTSPECVVALARVRRMGDTAVPLIFEEVRAHPSRLDEGKAALQSMADDGWIDPNVPYVRRVLMNKRENERVRKMASAVLVYTESSAASLALADCAVSDSSPIIRAACTRALAQQACESLRYRDGSHIHPIVTEVLRRAAQDHDPLVRYAACDATGELALSAEQHKISLPWTRSLLEQCLGDPDLQVRTRARHRLFPNCEEVDQKRPVL